MLSHPIVRLLKPHFTLLCLWRFAHISRATRLPPALQGLELLLLFAVASLCFVFVPTKLF